MRLLSLLAVTLLSTAGLWALDGGTTLYEFAFDPEVETVPDGPTAVMTVSAQEKPIPLFMAGASTKGSLVITVPESGKLLKMAHGSDAAAHLLEFGDIKGSLGLNFHIYGGGHPKEQLLGAGHYQAKHHWQVDLDKFTELTYIGRTRRLLPSPFAAVKDQDYDIAKAKGAGSEPGTLVFQALVKGSLKSSKGGKTAPFNNQARLMIKVEKGKPTLTVVCDAIVKGADLGMPEGDMVHVRCSFIGYPDPQAGSKFLSGRKPGKIDLSPREDLDDLDSDLDL